MRQHAMIRKIAVFFAGISLALCAPISQAQQNSLVRKPPPGAHVAIFEFADLECPMCARQNPVIKDAAAKYHVPWLRHDFPLQMHVWSFQAAVNARWFDEQPKHLGNEYRDAVFADQNNIETKDDLRQFTDKFAQQHGMAVPFVIDPQGKLADEVKADLRAGHAAGRASDADRVDRDRSDAAEPLPYTEVTDFNKLYTMLDQAAHRRSHERSTRECPAIRASLCFDCCRGISFRCNQPHLALRLALGLSRAFSMQMDAIQAALREQGIDAWLFYDHHHRDPIAYRILGLPETAHVTRRWYYLVPAEGEPRKLVHRIEAGRLDSLPGSKGVYSSWQELGVGAGRDGGSLPEASPCSIRRATRSCTSRWSMRARWRCCAGWERDGQLRRSGKPLRGRSVGGADCQPLRGAERRWMRFLRMDFARSGAGCDPPRAKPRGLPNTTWSSGCRRRCVARTWCGRTARTFR